MTVDLHGPVNVATLLKFMLLTMSVKFSWADSACGPPSLLPTSWPHAARSVRAQPIATAKKKYILKYIYILAIRTFQFWLGDDANFTRQDFSGKRELVQRFTMTAIPYV